MIPVQLDLFEDEQISEKKAFCQRLVKTESTLDKVRKGTYAHIAELKRQHGALKSEYEEMRQELNILKRGICRGEIKT